MLTSEPSSWVGFGGVFRAPSRPQPGLTTSEVGVFLVITVGLEAVIGWIEALAVETTGSDRQNPEVP